MHGRRLKLITTEESGAQKKVGRGRALKSQPITLFPPMMIGEKKEVASPCDKLMCPSYYGVVFRPRLAFRLYPPTSPQVYANWLRFITSAIATAAQHICEGGIDKIRRRSSVRGTASS